jgi:hypothetical protein
VLAVLAVQEMPLPEMIRCFLLSLLQAVVKALVIVMPAALVALVAVVQTMRLAVLELLGKVMPAAMKEVAVAVLPQPEPMVKRVRAVPDRPHQSLVVLYIELVAAVVVLVLAVALRVV